MLATEKVIASCFYKFVYQGAFVNVEITFFTKFLEILNADGIYLVAYDKFIFS